MSSPPIALDGEEHKKRRKIDAGPESKAVGSFDVAADDDDKSTTEEEEDEDCFEGIDRGNGDATEEEDDDDTNDDGDGSETVKRPNDEDGKVSTTSLMQIFEQNADKYRRELDARDEKYARRSQKKSTNGPVTIETALKASDVPAGKVVFFATHGPVSPVGYPESDLAKLAESLSRKVPSDADVRPTIAFQLGLIDSSVADFRPGKLEPKWIDECGFRTAGFFPSQVPVVRMFGCTADDLSVYVRVHGFEPYLWCRLVDATPESIERIGAALEPIRRRLDAQVRASMSGGRWRNGDKTPSYGAPYSGPTVVRLELADKRPIRGFRTLGLPFLRMVTALPKMIPVLRGILESGGSISDDAPAMECYEADFPYVLRFMVDKEIKGCDWISIDRKDATLVHLNSGNALDLEGGGYCARRKVAEERIIKLREVMGWRSSNSPTDSKRPILGTGQKFSCDTRDDQEMRSAERHACEDIGPDGGDAFGERFEKVEPKKNWDSGATRKRRRWQSDSDWFRPLPRFARCGKGESRCTYEIDAFWSDVKSMGCEGEWAVHAPQRILSFDTEWIGKGNAFPELGKDPITTVCFSVGHHVDPKPQTCVALQLGECTPVPDAATLWFKDERTLLMAFRDLFVAYAPDVVTGYNINNFDFAYLFERAKTLGIGKRFADLSRVRSEVARCIRGGASIRTKAQALEVNEIAMTGIEMLDAQIAIKREHKLGSYTLNAVSARFLGMQKLDVSHTMLPGLQSGTPEEREKIPEYCKRDSELPFLLLCKLMLVPNYIEMARATTVPISYLLTRGQQIKVAVQMYRRCRKMGLVIDSGKRRDLSQMESKYEGATVLVPVRGFHDYPVATLDFASLYPSIMISHNLCYSTLLSRASIDALHPDNYEVMPHGDAFVRSPKYFDPIKLAEFGVGASPTELGLSLESNQFVIVGGSATLGSRNDDDSSSPPSLLVDDYEWKLVDGATIELDLANRLKLAQPSECVPIPPPEDPMAKKMAKVARCEKVFSRTATAKLGIGGKPESFGFRRDREYETEPYGKWYLKAPGPISLAAARKLRLVEKADYEVIEKDAQSDDGAKTMVRIDTTRRIGVLPLILQSLLSARGAAKKLLAAEKDPGRRAVYDGRQLALKISSNSVYGFTGAQQGRLPEPRIASNVTAIGRKMIELTKDTVERKCERERAERRNRRRDDLPKVLYGDTDSVMVDFRLRAPLGRGIIRMSMDAIRLATNEFLTVVVKALDATKTKPEDAVVRAVDKLLAERLSAESERLFPDPELLGAELVAIWTRAKHAADATRLFDRALVLIAEVVVEVCSSMGVGPTDDVRAMVESKMTELRADVVKKANWAFDIGLVEEAARLGRIACKEVSSMLPWPCSLAFEKVFLCFLLISKKRYAGLKLIEGWSDELKRMIMKFEKDPIKYGIDAVSSSGLETVRRDNCALVRQTAKGTLAKVVLERDVRGAVLVVRRAIKQLHERDISLDMLVITTGYSRKESGYLGKQKHTEVVKKMRARDPANAPKIGDRVPFVMTAKWKGAKGFEQSEDPIYVMEHDVPIDTKYYVEKQLAKPLTRILKAVVPRVDLLFSPTATIDDILNVPDSERDPATAASEPKIVIRLNCGAAGRPAAEGEDERPSKSIASDCMMTTFAVRVGQPCLGCRMSQPMIDVGETRLAPALCARCLPDEEKIRAREMAALADVEDIARRLEETCAKCQGKRGTSAVVAVAASSSPPTLANSSTANTESKAEEKKIDCANVECPTLFVKGKTARDLRDHRERVRRFDIVVVEKASAKPIIDCDKKKKKDESPKSSARSALTSRRPAAVVSSRSKMTAKRNSLAKRLGLSPTTTTTTTTQAPTKNTPTRRSLGCAKTKTTDDDDANLRSPP